MSRKFRLKIGRTDVYESLKRTSMDKVYLLLRNNVESGPLSFEELIQQHLKPDDLIWVEGKSCAWASPTELQSLKPYVTGKGGTAVQSIHEANATTQTTYPLQS